MDSNLLDLLELEILLTLTGSFQGEVLLAVLLFLGTAILVALCVPGAIVSTATTSGAILGPWAAIVVVMLGALVGSQAFFLITRRFGRERLRRRLGGRLEPFQQRFAREGLWYVILLRLIGAPHFLITAGSALMPMRARSFAVATIVGMLPVISLASAIGSAI